MLLSDVLETTEMQKVASGFEFTEGPVWHPEGHLLFSDIPASVIYRLEPGQSATAWRTPSGNSNGLTFDRQGLLIACEHGNRRVTRTTPAGKIVCLATHYEGKRLNSPNDVVVRSDGSIYFTDPPYGVTPDEKELPYSGVYRIAPDGAMELLVDDFDRPNGLAFSPDEATLYIDDSRRRHVHAFDVLPDGSLGKGRIFAETKSEKQGNPDGMKVDVEGNIYCTGPGGIWVYEPNGELVGIVAGPEQPANLAFGGSDRKVLYVTARTSVYALRTKIPGVPVF